MADILEQKFLKKFLSLLISLKMAEQIEAKSAERSFASKIKN